MKKEYWADLINAHFVEKIKHSAIYELDIELLSLQMEIRVKQFIINAYEEGYQAARHYEQSRPKDYYNSLQHENPLSL